MVKKLILLLSLFLYSFGGDLPLVTSGNVSLDRPLVPNSTSNIIESFEFSKAFDLRSVALSAAQASLVSNAVSSFNKLTKSPMVLFVAIEGVSLAKDLYFSDSVASAVVYALAQEGKRIAPYAITGIASGVAESIDTNLFRDTKFSYYRFIKEGTVIIICFAYPLVFDTPLAIASFMSAIAFNRMFNLYEDYQATRPVVKSGSELQKKDSSAERKGALYSFAFSAAGVLGVSTALKYSKDLWINIKSSSVKNAFYIYTRKIADSIFSFASRSDKKTDALIA